MRLLMALLWMWVLMPGIAHALEPDKALHHFVRGNWSISQGLPQITAAAIAQDHRGYLWVGTQAGLARFDGVRFVTYTAENTPELAGNLVTSLLVTDDGKVWVGTYKGVSVHDGIGFTRVAPADENTGSLALDIRALAQDDDGTVWVATTTGLYRAEGDSLRAVRGSPALAQSLLVRPDGIVVGARGAVHHLAGGKWQAMPLPPEASAATVNRIVQTQGALWAATTLGLFVHSTEGWGRYEQAPEFARSPVDLLYVDGDGTLWAGGSEGLARIRDGRLTSFTEPTAPGGITGPLTAFEDREGGLWFGSQWEGLIRLGDSWGTRYGVAEGLNDGTVWSVAADPDDQRVWIGGNNGLSVLEDGRVRLVFPGSAFPHPQAYNLLAEADRIWVGTRRGLAIVNLDGTPRVSQPRLLEPMAGAQINGIVRVPGGDLWIPTMEGLYRLRGDTLRRFAQPQGLVDPRVRFFFRSRRGNTILAGTQSGLFEMRGERFVPVGGETGLPQQLDVTSIAELDDGQWVIGTLSERIYFLHDGRWVRLGAAEGMPANAPFFLTPHKGYLWAAGIRGITRVPLDDLAALAESRVQQARGEMLLNERGDPNSGQQGYCCNGAGNAKGFLRDGTLWLPTRDGVLAMATDSIRKNTVPPHAVIERILVGDQWLQASAVASTQLSSDSRDLSFEFTVLSFDDPKSTGVQYRLRGYDRDWQQADPLNRVARYTNLPPGDYVFEVTGSNNAGVASTKQALLPFAIQPRFHETAWFAWLLALLLLGLIYAGYQFQRHRHRLQSRALETLVLERTEALEIANRQLEEASHSDPLTGLRNRRYTANQIPADLAYYDRQVMQGVHQDEVMVFAMVDIDHFKSINDAYGHAAGDLVLQQFAAALTGLVRTGDYVVRWGGEEFLLVFRPMPKRNLQVIGDRLRDTVNAMVPDIGSGRTLKLTCSIGLAEYPLFHEQHSRSGWEVLIELADQALYFVKENGRDGWAAFRPTELTDVATLLADLREGPHGLIASGRLQVLGTKAPMPAPD